MSLQLREMWVRTESAMNPSREYLHEEALRNIQTITGKSAIKAVMKPGPFDEDAFRATLERRFIEQNDAHKGVSCNTALDSLTSGDLKSLWGMESTGGMPGVAFADDKWFLWTDTCPATSEERRNLCYNEFGEEESDRIYPGSFGNAEALAKFWGVTLLRPTVRHAMQDKFPFEVDGSLVWLNSPNANRDGRAFRSYSGGVDTSNYSIRNHRDDWGFRTEKLVENKFPPKPTLFSSFIEGLSGRQW